MLKRVILTRRSLPTLALLTLLLSLTLFVALLPAAQAAGLNILLVDDDDNDPDVRSYYTAALDALGYSYDVFDVGGGAGGGPDGATMADYDLVIWFSGHQFSPNPGTDLRAGPNATDEAELATYLDGGGALFLSSQDYYYDHDAITAFMSGYLGVATVDNDNGLYASVTGQNDFAGLGPYSLNEPFTDYSDLITPTVSASVAFVDSNNNANNAAIYTSNTVFFAFPWEFISDFDTANGQEALEAIIRYLVPHTDLVLSKSVSPDVVASGQPLTYTLVYTNNGPETATNVVITDVVPLEVINYSYLSSGATITPTGGVSYTWEVADLAQGQGGIITITGLLNTGLTGGLVFTNTAAITTASSESNLSNNSGAVPVTVSNIAPVADDAAYSTPQDTPLTGVLSADDANGDALTYGVATAPGHGTTVITDTTAGSFVYTPTAGYSGADAFAFVVTDTGGLTDTGTVDITIIKRGIRIAKTPDTQTVAPGSTVTFTIAVTNTSDEPLTNVTVSDPLAPGCGADLGTLNAGRDSHYVCSLDGVWAGFTNVASASGTPPVGRDLSDTDSAQVIVDPRLACSADTTAYWRLDETNGITYADFYDGHDGACASQCPDPTTGRVDGGQAFDGSTTGVDVPVAADFDWGASDSFSVEFWMRTDAASTCEGNEVVVGRDDNATSLHWWVGCREGGQAAFYLRDTGGTLASVIGSTDLSDGGWHHVVAARDAQANQIRLYVDGQQENATSTAYSNGFESLTATLNIGWLNLGGGYHFAGALDEVAVYHQALSPTEVERHYQEGQLAARWYCEALPFTPIIFSTPLTEGAVQWPYTYTVQAIGKPTPTFALVAAPTGMTIDPTTGLISWQPAVGQDGSHLVQVQASNLQGTDVQSFTVEVIDDRFCPADMIAYWKLDETDGLIYFDAYGDNSAVCNAGQCPDPTTGRVDGGQIFDSGQTGLNVSEKAAFNWGASDSFSVEFWMRTDATSTCEGNQVVVGRDDSATSLHWWVGCREGGQAAFYLRDTGGTLAWAIGSTDLADGDWHHVVAARDAQADQIRLYVDAQEEATTSATYPNGFDSQTAALNIGWLNRTSGFHFAGTVDEVAVHRTALDARTIERHNEKGSSGLAYCSVPAQEETIYQIFLPIVLNE